VLQIDSHSGSDEARARASELSAPLADAGISIMYQSSYTSDFIFVRPPSLFPPSLVFIYSFIGWTGSTTEIAGSHELVRIRWI